MPLFQIHQAIDALIFGNVTNTKTIEQAWDILARTYKGVDRT